MMRCVVASLQEIRANRRRLDEQRAEDIEFMLAHGEHPERAAARAGITLRQVEALMRRLGKRELMLLFAKEATHQRKQCILDYS